MRRASSKERNKPLKETNAFGQFARASARWSGSACAFTIALALIIGWIVTGPIFNFSNTWQLVINTATTIVTFLMVFLIQNTQNRDSIAMQLKLDELIRATKGCHNAVLDIEELSEEELDKMKKEYRALAKAALEKVRSGDSDLGAPEVKNHQAVAAKAR